MERLNLSQFEILFEKKMSEVATADDPAHDILHFHRVVRTAKRLAAIENAKLEVIIPAAWLHDLVNLPKNHPDRAKASRLSAKAAVEFLEQINYPREFYEDIALAISAHSFSANIDATSIEAKVVQDADRLDGLGAIGLARCFAVAAQLKRPIYAADDPFCEQRPVDDSKYTVDHFYAKLFKTVEMLKTKAGQEEGRRRADIMKRYLAELKMEIQP